MPTSGALGALYSAINVDVIRVQICVRKLVRKLAANAGDCAARRCIDLPV
jgi:hypothetical protein